MKKKKVATYLPPEMVSKLSRLSKKTRVPLAAYYQEAVSDLLKKYGEKL